MKVGEYYEVVVPWRFAGSEQTLPKGYVFRLYNDDKNGYFSGDGLDGRTWSFRENHVKKGISNWLERNIIFNFYLKRSMSFSPKIGQLYRYYPYKNDRNNNEQYYTVKVLDNACNVEVIHTHKVSIRIGQHLTWAPMYFDTRYHVYLDKESNVQRLLDNIDGKSL